MFYGTYNTIGKRFHENSNKTESIFSRMSNMKFFVYCTCYFYLARPSMLSKSFLFFTFCQVIFQRTRPLYKSLFGQTSKVLLTLVSKMGKKSYWNMYSLLLWLRHPKVLLPSLENSTPMGN